jgi:ribosome-associated heat shock protein Hsp15
MTEPRQRLDKWLWFARLTKSRTLAQRLILAGRVRVNRQKADGAADAIKPDDVLTVTLDSGVRVLKVLASGTRRGPATEARLLYADLTPPETAAEGGDRRGPRPTKRDRRIFDRLDADGFSADQPAAAKPVPKRSPP